MFDRANGVRISSVIVAYLMCGWVQADNPAITMMPDEQTFFEKYDETVDVAGQLRAGLMYDSVSGKVDVKNLRMDLSLQPVGANERACVRVASRNGAFSATWEITLKTEIDEQVITNFPTKHEAVLKRFATDELVAIASVVAPGQECTVAGRRYLPTSWGESNRQIIVAYLNADSTDALIAGKTQNGTPKAPCRILPATDENTAFDTICALNLAEASGTSGSEFQSPSELVVLRKNFSTVMKKINYPLSAK
ncbi:MAG: hypothetical protein AB8B87_25875 [Granulosicoccus sp.]